ncbi:MAG: PIG-L family deacetylase [Chitinophagaceae bacterium]|nr:MAG: PIG-L family deacetylase [Chitinophagaceae bacterium]
MKKTLSLLPALLFMIPVFSQTPARPTSSEMYLSLRKLNVLGSVLYIAAHPDDENTRLITWLSNDRLYRTGYLSLTRGDGGQNLIGNEQGIELGLIRTQELLAARRVDGGEQFFSRAYDFGFSKNPEETFTKWPKDSILADVVWMIRRFQPDVIITRFPTTGEGGHGHHTASAILANEAFTAAADPARFPGQLKYVKPWKAKRILWNSFNFGGSVTDAPGQILADVGGYNPLLGKSYGEIAAESRSQHKSQGFGVPATRGESMEGFRTTGGEAPVRDLMDNVVTTWSRVEGGAKVEAAINQLIAGFDLLHPEKSVNGLVALYRQLRALPEGYWRNRKMQEVQELIEECSGIFVDVTTQTAYAVQTDPVSVSFAFNNRSGIGVSVEKIHMDVFDTTFSLPLPANRNTSLNRSIMVSASKPLTQPYWLENPMQPGYFAVYDQLKIGQPDVDVAYHAIIDFNIAGERFSFTKPVRYKHTDPVKGELYQPFVVIPSTTVTTSPSMLVFRREAKQDKELDVQLNANKKISESVNLELRGGNEYFVLRDSSRPDKNLGVTFAFPLSTPAYKGRETEKFFSMASYRTGNDTLYSSKAIRAINYDHIPPIRYFFTDYATVLNIDLKTYNKKIGYIYGAGDKVPEALEQMGYDVTVLYEKDVARVSLSQFDAIITGVRAYNTNEWMPAQYTRLMKYVQDGGNLIVQYNTNSNAGPVKTKIGPFSFDISRVRVTDENAAVKILQPAHPVLNFPNKITPRDFDGWIQERSIYHAANYDKQYETILAMHDPGEPDDAGSLIVAKYGAGYFTYTGLVFFRELPAGVPGAYRLLANIIALNKKKPI